MASPFTAGAEQASTTCSWRDPRPCRSVAVMRAWTVAAAVAAAVAVAVAARVLTAQRGVMRGSVLVVVGTG